MKKAYSFPARQTILAIVIALLCLFVGCAQNEQADDASNPEGGASQGPDSNAIELVQVYEDGLTITEDNMPVAPEGYLLSMTVDGVETNIEPGTYEGQVVLTSTEYYGRIGYFELGGEEDYDYRAGLYVSDDGIVESRSVLSAITGGTFDENGASGITLDSTGDGFNGIIVDGKVDYTISDSTFNFISQSDGRIGSDFTGFGAVIYAVNDAMVTIDNCEIYTEGVVRPFLFVDDYADVLVKNSTYTVMGGDVYDGYASNADPAHMVASPWVLGIIGTARGLNVEANCSSLTIVDSECTTANWGVVSVDFGNNQQITLIDTVLSVLYDEEDEANPFVENYGSGYGIYATCEYANCKEYIYGTTFNVGTYALILCGGDVTFMSSNGDMLVENPDQTFEAEVIYEGKGKGNPTVINSDGFGFMAHNYGSINVTDGTIVNTDNAAFLMRCGDVNINVNGQSEFNVEDGVLLQMLDSDDRLAGVTFPEGYAGPVFNTEYFEKEGWASENGSITEEGASGTFVTFSAEDIDLKGDLYNGTGYYGLQAIGLVVTLGADAKLEGAITAAECRHIDENGDQLTYFTSDQYYYLGHVENRNYYNGNNSVEVTLTDNAVWTVTDECILSSLLIGSEASIVAPEGKTLSMTVNGVATAINTGSWYEGEIVISVK